MKNLDKNQLLHSIPNLLTRITIGFVFFQSGWGKLHHLGKVIEFFESLKIPFAQLQAPFVATFEFLGGILLLLGLGVRLISIPLMVIMSVAVATAKSGDIHELGDLFSVYEYLYVLLLFWLVVEGAGLISVDYLLKKKGILGKLYYSFRK